MSEKKLKVYQSRKGKFFLLDDHDEVVELEGVNFEVFKDLILKKNPFTGIKKLKKFLESVE